eukprot:g11795.t2
MSKKGGKKAKAKVPEIDPDSPEWMEEVARKQTEAYDMVQRAMTRSQIDVVLATRDDLLKQRAELEARAKQQSEDQSEIYQYLRNKLKDNYVAIAELETKVSKAHDERLQREKQLLATIKDLNEERETEKTRLEGRLATLDVELTAIKEYQENSEVYQQTLRDMEAKIASCNEAFSDELVLMNQQLEEEWETGRRDKEERRKITKKAAAKATQEQLGPRTKIRIAQNKKMMSELRFQCFEVEKMHRARNGLIKSNTHLLAQAASARHRVEELARRSHLLQRIIRYMHQKLQTRRGPRGDIRLQVESNPVTHTDRSGGRQQHARSAATGSRPGESGSGGGSGGSGGAGGGGGGESGALYKLAGMSTEERQHMLDLREELRREEVGITAAQSFVAEMREELVTAEAERSRVLALKTDLARVLASCHEDPLLGTDAGNVSAAQHRRTRQAQPPHPNLNSVQDSEPRGSMICDGLVAGSGPIQPMGSGGSDGRADTTSNVASDRARCDSGRGGGCGAAIKDDDEGGRHQGLQGSNTRPGSSAGAAALLPAIADAERSLPPQQPETDEAREQEEGEGGKEEDRQHQQHQRQHHQHQQKDAMSVVRDRRSVEADRGADGPAREPPDAVGIRTEGRRANEGTGDGLALWPESSILPPSAPAEDGGGAIDGDGRSVGGAPRFMDADTLKAVARLFLSKLQISVETITPRLPVPTGEATIFPALMSEVSPDGSGGPSAFGIRCRTAASRQPRSSCTRRTRQLRGKSGKGAKRKGTSSGGGGSGGAGAPPNADSRSRSERRDCSRRSDCVRTSGGGSGGVGDSRLFGVHRAGKGSRGSPRGGRGHRRRSGQGSPDDATSWSDWHTTGIPSWDILEPSVRQTKRRRTRDAACQTLTYRELRDNANAISGPQDVGWKNGGKNPARPHGEGAQRYRQHQHQQQQQQQQQHSHLHVAPATRFVSMFHPPGSPLSSAATASTASVYRVTDGGGIVHGAIVRGGGGGRGHSTGRKQRQAHRQAMAIRGDGNGGWPRDTETVSGANEFPSQGGRAAQVAASAANTMTARPHNREWRLDDRCSLLCSPPPSQQDGAQDQRLPEKGGQDSAPPTAGHRYRRPETTDSQRLSPHVAQVSVSWGQGAQREGEAFEEEREVSPSTADHAPEVEVPSYTRGGRGPEAFQGDHNVGYQEMVAGIEGQGSGSFGGGGLAYEPLSRGPDYRKGYARIDGRGSGYVVWIPRREQYWKQHQQRECDGESEEDEGEDGSPLVLYGGGYDGLFSGGLEQALDSCDCLSPPLRWVRIPLELLPPPAHSSSPSRSSSAKQAATAARSSDMPSEQRAAEDSYDPPSTRRRQEQREGKKKFGFVGVAPEPDGGWGAARKKPSRVHDGGGGGSSARGRTGGRGPRDAGLGREGRCTWEGGDEGSDDPTEREAAGNYDVVGDGDSGKRVRRREMVDLWWLTDPPAPKVSAEALRLRVATETIQTLPADAEEAPDVVCTIEVCQGRPYLPGRLQRYPNVATSTGAYRAVHSYRVLSSGPRSAAEGISSGGGGSTVGSGGSVFSSPAPPDVASPWRRSDGERVRAEEEELACVSVIDVKPSHWYNVRHRFSWRVGGGSSLEGIEEVVTATRHVHTEAYLPPIPRPPKPYAILGCSRREHTPQQHTSQQTQPYGDRRRSREQVGRRDDPGLVFHFRLRWGPGGRGAGRNEGRGFGQGSAAQEIEYILQQSILQPPGRTARTKKAGASSPATGGDGAEISAGGSRPVNSLRSTTGGARSPKPEAATSAATRNHATWSPGGLLGGSRAIILTAATDADNDPFSEQLRGDAEPEASGTERGGEGGWGVWRTIRRTRKTREAVELPCEASSSAAAAAASPSFREGGAVPEGLRYRVGARRKDGPQKAVFSEALEVPSALLARLYDIEEISATRRPLQSPETASKKRTAGGARPQTSGREARRVRPAGRTEEGLEDEEAANFLRAFEMSEDEGSFPTRVAWELQAEFWPHQAVEARARSSFEAEREAKVIAEAESIQRTLAFPVNTKYIAGME